MAFNFKEVMSKPERLAPGHRMCAGCGGTIAVRTVLRALHEGIRRLSEMQPAVWKYPASCIHIPHGRTATCTMHLKMQVQHFPVLKLLTTH